MCPGQHPTSVAPGVASISGGSNIPTSSRPSDVPPTAPGALPGPVPAPAFTNAARLAFEDYVLGQAHTNRYRMDYTRQMAIKLYLDNPNHPAVSPEQQRIKSLAKQEYAMINGILHGVRDDTHAEPRIVARHDEVFNIISRVHCTIMGHSGRDKTFREIDQRYYGINKKEVGWMIKNCTTCAKTKAAKTVAPLQPIVAVDWMERLQIDLINFRHLNRKYKWCLHIRDHYSKFSMAFALEDKESKTIAHYISIFLMFAGVPGVLQCDNGTEFKGACLILLRTHGIPVVHSKPRTPQTNGLIEQANHVLKMKIHAWMEDNECDDWWLALPESIIAMSRQIHSTTNKAPYTVVFKKLMPNRPRLSAQERRTARLAERWEEDDGAVTDFIEEINTLEEFLDPALLSAPEGSIQVRAPNPYEVPPEATATPRTNTPPPCTGSISLSGPYASKSHSPLVALSSQTHFADSPLVPSGMPEPCVSTPSIMRASHPRANTELATARAGGPSTPYAVRLRDEVVEYAARVRTRMEIRHNKTRNVVVFEEDDLVALKIPKEDRNTTDEKRIFCRIMSSPRPSRYMLGCEFGPLERPYLTKDMALLEPTIANNVPSLEILRSGTLPALTLAAASRLLSRADLIQVRCSCKGNCSTQRCSCRKHGSLCTMHCHGLNVENPDCTNRSEAPPTGLFPLRRKPTDGQRTTKRRRANTRGDAVGTPAGDEESDDEETEDGLQDEEDAGEQDSVDYDTQDSVQENGVRSSSEVEGVIVVGGGA